MSDASEPTSRHAGASPAGIYDYWLGGTGHSDGDQRAGRRIMRAIPEIRRVAWANRGFLMRAATWMAGQGIRQFIDLGAGFPGQRPTHEVARAAAAGCRVLYTDNDPDVIERGRRMLDGIADTAVVEADLRRPSILFGHPETARLIDPARPTGLLAVAVTQFLADGEDPWSRIKEHMAALSPGSFLALSAPTADHKVERKVSSVVAEYASTAATVNVPRTRTEIERFFDGLDLVPPYPGAAPGVSHVGLWGCDDPEAADDDASRWFYAGVARKSRR
jgi:hypothetical protein